MRYKFKIIDILTILLIPIMINDLIGGYIRAFIMDAIIVICVILSRIDDMKRGKK